MVTGDATRLRQAVDNLLANVRTHTPAGTPARISLLTTNGNAVLEVADQGPGLPPDDREAIFNRFYRADPSRSRDHGGAGLGLAIVDAIVRAHGGHVFALDNDPKGAMLRIVLPLRTVARRPAATPTAADATGAGKAAA